MRFLENVKIVNYWYTVNRKEILEIFTEDIPGIEDLVLFYSKFNGGNLENGLYLYADIFYKPFVLENYPFLVEEFLYIPLDSDKERSKFIQSIERVSDIIAMRYDNDDETEDFLLFHRPIASNYAGNYFWIDIQSGEIKYMNFESMQFLDEAIVIAPSFGDFLENLVPNRRKV